MQLSITIASLGRGHHVECKDLEELLESEDTVRNACKNLTRFLEVAATFDGSEIVVEYVNGEEKVHIAESARPLLEYMPGPDSAANADSADKTVAASVAPLFDSERQFLRRRWTEFRAFDLRVQATLGIGAGLVLLLLLRACS